MPAPVLHIHRPIRPIRSKPVIAPPTFLLPFLFHFCFANSSMHFYHNPTPPQNISKLRICFSETVGREEQCKIWWTKKLAKLWCPHQTHICLCVCIQSSHTYTHTHRTRRRCSISRHGLMALSFRYTRRLTQIACSFSLSISPRYCLRTRSSRTLLRERR